MSKYRYHLDKTSKKFHCPKCGKKRFVRYVENETKNYADSVYGRCDRETSCRYLTYPNYESIISYDYVSPPPVKPTYIDNEILEKTLTKYDINPLVIYLLNNTYKEIEVKQTIDKYKVGTSKEFNGSTVFWQMDHSGNIRTGKIMNYISHTGKRVKDKFSINWVHSILEIPNYNLKQCLFGLHLLDAKSKQIAIVESEKTALIMSIEFPQETWMATGSLQGFKNEYLVPLKVFDIIAFPDKGGYEKWNETATELNKIGFSIVVSNSLEKEQYNDGWDLVDVLQYEDSK